MSTLLDNSEQKKLIFDTFSNLIDCIKSHDDSVYFWIYGGAMRRLLNDGYLNFSGPKYNEGGFKPFDIDIHCHDDYNFNAIKNVLVDKMGFKVVREQRYNVYLEFFNVRIDLIDGGKAKDNDFQFVLTGNMYWCDFTVSAITLDSDYVLTYHKDAFKDMESKNLRFVERDYDYIQELIDSHAGHNKRLLKGVRLFIGSMLVNCTWFYNFKDKKYKPRYWKHSEEGFVMTKENYDKHKKSLDKLLHLMSQYLPQYKKSGWWQKSHWYGIIQHQFGTKLCKRLFIPPLSFDVVEEIMKKIDDSDNSIIKESLKGLR